MNSPSHGGIRIGDCTLDLDASRLLRNGEPVHVRAKTFGVLRHLALNAGRVIGKDELFDTLWPGLAVTEDTLTQSIRELRVALGSVGAALLRTVPRRGYVLEVPSRPQVTAERSARPPLVVILPFVVTSFDVADAALIDGLIEEVTHATARYGQIRVIARHSAFQFRPDTTPPGEAARKLGVDYFVEGTARRLGNELHISPAMCDAANGRQIWGETFRPSPAEFRSFPTTVAHRIITRLTLDIARDIRMRTTTSGTSELGAYQHFVTAVSLLRQYAEGVNERARDHLDEALRIDPDFALAHAYRGMADLLIHNYGSAPFSALEQALAHAQRGVQIAPEEARCHWIVGQTRLYMGQHAAAEMHLVRALDLSPFDPDVMAQMGYLATMRGQAEQGVVWIRRAIEINPLHPAWYHSVLGISCMHAGQFADAIAFMQMVPRLNPWRHTRIASCYAVLGDTAAAARHMAQAMAERPNWNPIAGFSHGLELEHKEDMERVLGQIELALSAWRLHGE